MTAAAAAARLAPIDRLRGLVIVLMALDHARHFLQPERFDPEDLRTASLPYFLSRWLTHLCAPAFVLLAGAALDLGRPAPAAWPDRRLLKRGLWLIILELTYVSFCWQFGFARLHAGVLWAIGGAMALAALLHPAPRWLWPIIGLAAPIAWALIPWRLPVGPWGALVWSWSGAVGPIDVGFSYSLLPWFGVLCLGRALAPTLRAPARAAAVGGAALLAFGLMAALGVGDPAPPEDGLSGWRAVAAVLNPSKYPPSAQFQALFLGLALSLLPALAALPARLAAPLAVLGRVPLFFYLVHLPVYNALGRIFAYTTYGTMAVPADAPPALGLMLGAWALGLVIVTPACAAWAAFKARHPGAWWSAYL